MPILRTLLATAIDYAGLFPPAGLSLEAAVANYAGYRRSEDAWALGRFIVGVERLGDLGRALRDTPTGSDESPWPVAVLVSGDPAESAHAIRAFNAEHGACAVVDTVEGKAQTPDAAASFLKALPEDLARYIEIPLASPPGPFLDVLRVEGAYAKIRMGGTSPELVPAPERVLTFLEAQHGAGVAFKATAGLHHPVRGRFALTYAPNSPTERMFGYLNLFTATTLLHAGAGAGPAAAALVEADPAAFQFEEDALRWRDHLLLQTDVDHARRQGMRGFGSCSFREPLDELATLAAA